MFQIKTSITHLPPGTRVTAMYLRVPARFCHRLISQMVSSLVAHRSLCPHPNDSMAGVERVQSWHGKKKREYPKGEMSLCGYQAD